MGRFRRLRLPALLLLLASALAGWALAGSQAGAGDPAPEPADTATEGDPLETFVPSEKVPADAAVTFPVDI